MLVAAACVAVSYAIGMFPTALLVGRHAGVDPTTAGSGNPGATNVMRTAGWRAGLLTLLGDGGKGAAAAALGWLAGGHGLGTACGLAAVVGHVVPVARRFHGGKGVATAGGMVLVLFPLLAVLGAVVYATGLALTRIGSVGSLAAAVAVPMGAVVAGVPGWELAALVACELVVVLRHAGNIARLARGQEGTFRP